MHMMESGSVDALQFTNPDQLIIDESIEDVGDSIIGYFLRHPVYIAIAFGPVIFFDALLFLFSVPIPDLYLFPAIMPIAVYRYVRNRVLQQFMRQFAAANGFSYEMNGSMSGLDGTLFSIGHGQSVSNVVRGTYHGCPMRLFDYRYTTGTGRNARTHLLTIFRLDFDIAMPDITLENRGSIFGESVFGGGIGKEILTLEGDFSDHFTLAVPKDYEIEALQVFTPDVMAELMQKGRNFSMEIIGGHLFLYAKKTITTKRELLAFYDLARYFAETLVPRFARMKSGIAAMNRSFGGGSR